jgi:hypothetical protein
MSLTRVLNANEDVSAEFSIRDAKQITLVGTPGAAWTVERAEGYLNDGEARVWSIDIRFAQTVTGGDVTGTPGYVYRINLGSGNGAADLMGNVADMRISIWR